MRSINAINKKYQSIAGPKIPQIDIIKRSKKWLPYLYYIQKIELEGFGAQLFSVSFES